MPDHRDSISQDLQQFTNAPLREAALSLLATLGYQSDKTIALEGSKPAAFLELLRENNPDVTFNQEKVLFSEWKSADLLFQLTDEEITRETSLFKDTDIKPGLLRSFRFLATLDKRMGKDKNRKPYRTFAGGEGFLGNRGAMFATS